MQVWNLKATYSSDAQTITVNWENLNDIDRQELILSYKTEDGVEQTETFGKDATSFTISGVVDGSTYTISVRTKDALGNTGNPVEIRVTTIKITKLELSCYHLDNEQTDRNITVTVEGNHFDKVTKLVEMVCTVQTRKRRKRRT